MFGWHYLFNAFKAAFTSSSETVIEERDDAEAQAKERYYKARQRNRRDRRKKIFRGSADLIAKQLTACEYLTYLQFNNLSISLFSLVYFSAFPLSGKSFQADSLFRIVLVRCANSGLCGVQQSRPADVWPDVVRPHVMRYLNQGTQMSDRPNPASLRMLPRPLLLFSKNSSC